MECSVIITILSGQLQEHDTIKIMSTKHKKARARTDIPDSDGGNVTVCLRIYIPCNDGGNVRVCLRTDIPGSDGGNVTV